METILVIPNKKDLLYKANNSTYKDFNNPKICERCGVEFYHGKSNTKYCGLCYIKYTCHVCNKNFILNFNNIEKTMLKKIILSIKNKTLNNIKIKCPICKRTGPGICARCNKYANKRNCFSVCSDCAGLKRKFCKICNKITLHNGKYCNICYPNKSPTPEFNYCKKCNKITWHIGSRCIICKPLNTGPNIKYCKVCKKETLHNGSICNICDPKSSIQFYTKKYCSKCDKTTLHIKNRCNICNPFVIPGYNKKFCKRCNKITKHNHKFCLECEARKSGFDSYLEYSLHLKEEYAIFKGFNSYEEYLINNIIKTLKLENNFNKNFNDIIYSEDLIYNKILKLYRLFTLLGNNDFVKNKIPKNICIDKNSIRGVYSLKIKNNFIYIGETLNLENRKNIHIKGLKIKGRYPLTGKYITTNMIYNKDYTFEVLATPPNSMNNYEAKRWMSCVESYFINLYKTYEKGNNKTGTW